MPKESVSGTKTGVFIGGNYGEHRVSNLRDLDHIPSFDATGNQIAFLAGRLAYCFNLQGPTITVDTACSSSMHALHLAVQSIRAGESEQAIVGASHVITHPDIWVSMGKLHLFSEEGKTYAFDHRARSGYSRGEGAGCLVLKPLHQAQRDNDHIFAVIRHTGINHNGRTVGIVAPSADEQEQLLRRVFAEAAVDPREVGFVEAHGTGTEKGDPIEATAIYRAIGRYFSAKEPLFIGSSKPNVGHLECASGIVSVIKTALMLYYGFILPNRNFEKPNDAIPLDKWNMRVATAQNPWPRNKKYACVNNFGFSGSNATCVLSVAPPGRGVELGVYTRYNPQRLFVLSANDETALRNSVRNLGIWLEQHAELYQTIMPRNLAYTLCQRRSHLPWRVAVVASLCGDVATALNSPDLSHVRASGEAPRLAFVYTGQGAQWYAMGRELLHTYPVFLRAIERADRALDEIGAGMSAHKELTLDKKSSRVGLARISQPVCTAVQLALTDLLASWGLRPSAVTGHSSGEIAAAYAAGAISFEHAMKAAYYRGQVTDELKESYPNLRGAMMAVGAGAEELAPMLDALNKESSAKAVVACENSPASTTLSGDEDAIDRLAKVFQEKGVFNRKLFVDMAYHSPHMKLVAKSYLNSIWYIQPRPDDVASSNVEFYSSLRGRKVSLSELGAQYWVDNLTQAVLFSPALQRLCTEHNPDILVEVGPHAALKGPIMQILKKLGPRATKISYLPTLVRDQDAARTCLETAGQLFVRGCPLDFYQINHNREEEEWPDMVTSLFPYPWSRQKYWYEPRLARQHRLKPFARHDLLGTLADWSSELEPTWRNVIRTEDLPWLKDYQVRSRMVFPVAGFMSMVIEAAWQSAALRGLDADQFDIKNLKIAEHLFLSDDKEFEVLLNFRASDTGEDGCHEFRISSYEASRGWLDHCSGTVATDLPSAKPMGHARTEDMEQLASKGNPAPTDSSSDSSPSEWDDLSKASDADRESHTPDSLHSSSSCSAAERKGLATPNANFYRRLGAMGMSYPPCFQSLTGSITDDIGPNDLAAYCYAPDTATDMPMQYETPYKVHPQVLDAMLQIALLNHEALPGTGAKDPGEKAVEAAHLPSAIRHVSVYSKWRKTADDCFSVWSGPEARRTNTLLVEVSSTDPQSPDIVIAGLEFKSLESRPPEVPRPRELCFKLDWEQLHKAEPENQSQLKTPAKVVIVTEPGNAAKDPLVGALSSAIKRHTGVAPAIRPLQAINDWTSSFIVLSELRIPLLCAITKAGLEQVKKLLTLAPGLMWVTCGATRFPILPHANMALGLIRTARSERSAVAATLDLDPHSKLDVHARAKLIWDAFASSVLLHSEDAEMEFAEDGGKLVVPRIIGDEKLDLDVNRSLGPSAPYLQDFNQQGRRLSLVSPAHGCCDDGLYFEDAADEPLGEDDVEMAVVASLLSPDDLTSSRQDATSASIARSCSGTVTRVGSNVHDIPVGSRVCALTRGRFGTHARALRRSVVVVPDTVGMEFAALIPGAFAPAYCALRDINTWFDHVLIQLSGPVGLAAVEVARSLEVDHSVLVQSAEEKETARRLRVGNILEARSAYLRHQVDKITSGEGMKVVLALSGMEAVSAWECLADFGRYVEIRTSEAHRRTRAELGANATFISVNMASIAAANPSVMEETLKAIMERIEAGKIRPLAIKPALIPVSELSKGLQMVRDGAVEPVVAVVGEKEQVKVSGRQGPVKGKGRDTDT
ncbi:hypothetical protein VTK56DRAFT_3083 [Thermocarpiscus australiensis]